MCGVAMELIHVLLRLLLLLLEVLRLAIAALLLMTEATILGRDKDIERFDPLLSNHI